MLNNSLQVDYSLVDKSLLDSQLVQRLEALQNICNSQIIITSGFRTVAEELALGGTGTGAHTRGLAVDIRCRTSQDRFNIIRALILYGFNRIGDEVDHLHADLDKSLAPNVLFRE
jgi:hypothetical protein